LYVRASNWRGRKSVVGVGLCGVVRRCGVFDMVLQFSCTFLHLCGG
jgi:hypothetical protein